MWERKDTHPIESGTPVQRVRYAPVRVIDDALVGTALVVAGAGPTIARVLGPSGPISYAYRLVETAWVEPRAHAWPDLIPVDLHRYHCAAVITADDLHPVDLLRIAAGAMNTRDRTDRFYLWQRALPGEERMQLLTENDLRAALASEWVRRSRSDAAGCRRAIATGRLED